MSLAGQEEQAAHVAVTVKKVTSGRDLAGIG